MDLRDTRPGEPPSIIVTGASGLVGRHFIEAVKERFYIYAVARRGQIGAEIPVHENIRWFRCDIGDGPAVSRLLASIAEEADIDFLFHFAGYYDFDYRDSPEYRRTNVEGTRHLLEAAAGLGLKRFVFSSSLAVSDFAGAPRVIDEGTPPDGDYPYARSKKEAEDLVASFSGKFPCTIARLAAIYSDWCEYAPLYVLLRTWVAGGLRSRLIAGRGRTAIPYLHVSDLNCFWLKIIEKHGELGPLDVLAASPSGCVSHNELFAAAMLGSGDLSGRARHIPLKAATAGVWALRILGLLVGRPPFERPWMMRYIDRRMVVDAGATHRRLAWGPRPRYHVMRRLLFLIENMKRDPLAWEQRNLAMTKQAVTTRPGLKIYNAMLEMKGRIVDEHVEYLTSRASSAIYPSYHRLGRQELRLRAELMYQMLESSIRLGDHLSILAYANYLARRRFAEGVACEELTGSLEHMADRIESALMDHPGLGELRKMVHFEIGITMQLIVDEIEDAYENLASGEGAGC